MLKYSGERKYSKLAAEKYLTYYDNNSSWAKYLSSMTQVTVKEIKRNYLAVGGIMVNDNIKMLLDKWGKSDYTRGVVPGSEIWYYKDKGDLKY
jgi:hypothetical protein